MGAAFAVTLLANLLLVISSLTGAEEDTLVQAKYLMTIGGRATWNSEQLPPSFVSLSSGQDSGLPQCMLKPPKDIPEPEFPGREKPVVIALADGQPLSCNGALGETNCYKYNPEMGDWHYYGETLYSGKARAYDFHPEVGLVIAGGYNGTEMDVVEMSQPGQDLGRRFERLPNLPMQLTYSCLVIINMTTIFVAGGQSIYAPSVNNVFTLNLASREWKEEPQMKEARSSHTCSLVETENGSKKIVVVGGSAVVSMIRDNFGSVEIFDTSTNEWITGRRVIHF